MATSQGNKKVYVSPGVYTSETDLSFVAQSVGVTTLGIVGETIKGPAFEPVFVTNYDEFQAYFGGTEPTKFVNTQIPKYEAAYIAKSYLQQSNQLFVTRVLGLSGYDAGPSWSLKVKANVDPLTIGINPSSGVPFTANFSGSVIGQTAVITNISNLPSDVQTNYNVQYRLQDGSTSTLSLDFSNYLDDIIDNTSLSSSTAVVYGSILNSEFATISGLTNIKNVYKTNSVNLSTNDLSAGSNDAWYYGNFENTTGDDYTGYSFFYRVTSMTSGGTSADTTYTGTISGMSYTFTGTAYSDYNDMVVATLRSRGISLYGGNNHGPIYEVSGLTDLDLICTGQYSGISKNPYATFLISGITNDNANFSFETSLLASSSKYITKVFGIDNFGKPRTQFPVFVEEIYQASLNYAYNKGYIRGLSCDLIALPDARSQNPSSIAWNLERYQSPETPFLVSELRGNKVDNLFKFISISDGDSANTEIKISIANLSFNNMSFDVLVRNFFDTDSNPVVIEKFTNCNMDPLSNNYIAKKIGTANGEYELLSKYIMVEMADGAPENALPCGFRGYTQREYESTDNPSPWIAYKTKYFFPGETIFNPPFGTSSGGSNAVESSGDIVRRTYLGFSTQFGVDESFLEYKGKQNPIVGWELATESSSWNYLSKGFHMDSGATVVTISNSFQTSGQSAFECGVAEFRNDPETQENPYYFIFSRKFTVCLAGGFDGWDIYREYRTNEDRFQLGASGFLAGAYPSTRYPSATGDGLFKRIVVGENTSDFANTDYYAYLLGILTYSNPEATNINVFATASIDYVYNSNLCEEAIDMIQFQRADSIYIVTTVAPESIWKPLLK